MIVGAIISRIKVGNDDILAIEDHWRHITTTDKTIIQQFIEMVSCKDVFRNQALNDVQGCYVMTLGVIDECRKFGLGTALLTETYNVILSEYP